MLKFNQCLKSTRNISKFLEKCRTSISIRGFSENPLGGLKNSSVDDKYPEVIQASDYLKSILLSKELNKSPSEDKLEDDSAPKDKQEAKSSDNDKTEKDKKDKEDKNEEDEDDSSDDHDHKGSILIPLFRLFKI